MYVCLCNDLKCHDVRTARDSGARTPSQVFRAHGLQPQCGKCIDCMRVILDEGQQQTPMPRAS